MAVALVMVLGVFLLFHYVGLAVVPLLLGTAGFKFWRGEAGRSGYRLIILVSVTYLPLGLLGLVQAWAPGSVSSAHRFPLSLAAGMALALLVLGLRARQAARVIEPPSGAPWWLP